ncbi:MAG: tetratricopeptide repeat protein [Elusimicrobia bacterium]|nr:tetratricopeptide repeat protein [Elusimicrobiota bacterium]
MTALARLLAAVLLAALAGGRAVAAFEEVGAGARAPGMGNAFTAIADDVYAVHYNPAGLALLQRPEVASSYSRLFLGLTDHSTLSNSFLGYAHPLKGGEWGTTATSWEQFSLNSNLYQEQRFALAYGRKLGRGWGPGELSGGLTAKYLRRSFGTFPEADNAMIGNGLQVGVGQTDPVLAGRKSVGVPDADVGLLYRFPKNYAFGLQLAHVPQPNVAFSKSDKDIVPLTARLALSYRSLLSTLAVQTENRRSPLGGMDQIFTLAAERWFPRLFIGDFAFRGALNLGTRDYRQVSLGLSYRTRRLGVDYAFALPINTVASTAGTHRVSLSMRFGSASEADESVELILEAMRKLKAGTIPELQATGPGLVPSQKVVLEEHVANARSLQAQAQYKPALERLSLALALSPADPQLLKAYGRLNFVAQYIASLPDYKTDPVHAALHQGILAYLGGSDSEAVEKVSYAWSLKPQHKGLDSFLGQLELATGLRRAAVKRPVDYWTEEQLTRAGAAVEEGRYKDALSLSLEVLKKDPDNVSAWQNVGTSYFALADYPRALQAWQKAYGAERDPTRRSAARGYIKAIERLMRKAEPKPLAPAFSPEEVQKLYNEGIDLYTSGRLEEAKKAFERALTLDASNVPAAKALRRVNEELGAR